MPATTSTVATRRGRPKRSWKNTAPIPAVVHDVHQRRGAQERPARGRWRDDQRHGHDRACGGRHSDQNEPDQLVGNRVARAFQVACSTAATRTAPVTARSTEPAAGRVAATWVALPRLMHGLKLPAHRVSDSVDVAGGQQVEQRPAEKGEDLSGLCSTAGAVAPGRGLRAAQRFQPVGNGGG